MPERWFRKGAAKMDPTMFPVGACSHAKSSLGSMHAEARTIRQRLEDLHRKERESRTARSRKGKLTP